MYHAIVKPFGAPDSEGEKFLTGSKDEARLWLLDHAVAVKDSIHFEESDLWFGNNATYILREV